jgi:UDP-N-acetylmuramate dehydrogenase
MMARAKTPIPALLDRLPKVHGRLAANAPTGPQTWFRVGGPAEVLFRPADEHDLAEFMAALPADVPVTVIGVGSNLLVRDGGIPGVTIRLGRGFTAIVTEGDALRAGAGALDLNVALTAAEAGIAGLEFLSGVPGTIKDVLVQADAIDRSGTIHRVPAAELNLSYRHTGAPEDWIFTGATLRGAFGDRQTIAARMGEIQAAREASQPIRSRTGGSTFANPPGHQAWQLIDAVGCRGLVRGGAMVSEKHTNFLINTGAASAADIEGLGEEVRRRVHAEFGIVLEWEIRRVGRPLADWRAEEGSCAS